MITRSGYAQRATSRGDRLAGQYRRFVRTRTDREQAMTGDHPVSAAYVREVILQGLDRQSGRDGRWEVEARPITGRDSWVFKASTPAAPWPLAVKVYCASVRTERIDRQYECLRRYHDSAAAPAEFGVPAPWAALPQHRAVLMQWIEEPRLDDLLRQAGGRHERLRLLAAAGGWLHWFHGRSEPVERPLNSESVLHRIDLMLGGEEGGGLRVRDLAFRRAYETLLRHTHAFSDMPVHWARTHGDFVPHNLFHATGRTIGIDTAVRLRPVIVDVCRFLVQAELKKPFISWPRALHVTGIEERDLEAFLAAYGPADPAGFERLLPYALLAEVVHRWASLKFYLRAGRPFRPGQAVTFMRYRRMARYAAAALEQAARP